MDRSVVQSVTIRVRQSEFKPWFLQCLFIKSWTIRLEGILVYLATKCLSLEGSEYTKPSTVRAHGKPWPVEAEWGKKFPGRVQGRSEYNCLGIQGRPQRRKACCGFWVEIH